MTYNRVCCCNPTQCVCTGCGFASSYRMGCTGYQLQWEITKPQISQLCPRNPPCYGGGGEEFVDHQVNVSINVGPVGGALTRYTTGPSLCCYRRTGNLIVSWSWSISSKWMYGIPDPNVCCGPQTASQSGSTTVPFCMTVTPCCVNDTLCQWIHTLHICDFQAGDEVEWVPSVNSSMIDCNDALERNCFRLGGGIYQGRSEYKALNLLVPADYTPLGFCPQCPSNCVDGSEGPRCAGYNEVSLAQNLWGPYSLYTTTCGSGTCLPILPEAVFPSFNGCNKYNNVPTSRWAPRCFEQDESGDCCGNVFEMIYVNPPCYT